MKQFILSEEEMNLALKPTLIEKIIPWIPVIGLYNRDCIRLIYGFSTQKLELWGRYQFLTSIGLAILFLFILYHAL